MPVEARIFIADIAERTARGRTPAPRDEDRKLDLDKPQPEGPGRLVKAFRRIAINIALVRGHNHIRPDDLRAIRRLAEDTVPPSRAAVYKSLAKGEKTIDELTETTELSESTIRRACNALEIVGLVAGHELDPDGRGRPATIWKLT